MKLHKYIAAFAILPAFAAAFFMLSSTASAGTNQCTWTGGGANNNWSTAENWACSVGTVPGTGYDVIFRSTAVTHNSVNDLPSSNVYSGLWYTGSCNGHSGIFSVTGNEMRLAGDMISDITGDCGTVTIAIQTNITLQSNLNINLPDNFATRVDLGPSSCVTPLNLSLGVHNITMSGAAQYDKGLNICSHISGSGDIVAVGDIGLWGNNSSYDGNISITYGDLDVFNENSLGNTTGLTSVGDNASLEFYFDNSVPSPPNWNVAENITMSGNPKMNGGMSGAKLIAGHDGWLYAQTVFDAGFTPNPFNAQDSTYRIFAENWNLTLSGDITIASNVDVISYAEHGVHLTGNIFGPSFTFNYDPAVSSGVFEVNGATNTTATANGFFSPVTSVKSLADAQPTNKIFVGFLSEVAVTGTRGDTVVESGGILKGTGTVGNIDSDNGILRPGLSPGILNTGNLDFDAATNVDIELEGTTPGAGGHDQFNVTGTVTLGNATLNPILFNGYVPANIGDSYTIINNDGADAVVGTFNGLAEGADVTVGAVKFTITYTGGDGNDVVLTTAYIPGPPGTGFGVLKESYIAPLAILTASAALLLYTKRKAASIRSRR